MVESKPMERPHDKPEVEAAPPVVTQFGHKNPPVGPKTNMALPDWRKDRDYENFNPTAEK